VVQEGGRTVEKTVSGVAKGTEKVVSGLGHKAEEGIRNGSDALVQIATLNGVGAARDRAEAESNERLAQADKDSAQALQQAKKESKLQEVAQLSANNRMISRTVNVFAGVQQSLAGQLQILSEMAQRAQASEDFRAAFYSIIKSQHDDLNRWLDQLEPTNSSDHVTENDSNLRRAQAELKAKVQSYQQQIEMIPSAQTDPADLMDSIVRESYMITQELTHQMKALENQKYKNSELIKQIRDQIARL
jgi:hypothetical protein